MRTIVKEVSDDYGLGMAQAEIRLALGEGDGDSTSTTLTITSDVFNSGHCEIIIKDNMLKLQIYGDLERVALLEICGDIVAMLKSEPRKVVPYDCV